tara:strand:- start:1114 stop:2124 length:1011 start_codon:yes stop_codon:yes gene_type:complete
MKRYKAAIIGLGVGERHIESYVAHADVDLITLCDFDECKLKDISSRYPEYNFIDDARSVLEDKEIDIVSVASYDNHHFGHIKLAIGNGKHVYVEKPICLYADELRAIRNLLRKNSNIQLSSNLTLRTCSLFSEVKNAIEMGDFGDLYFIRGDYLWGRKHKLTDGWRKDMPFYSIVYGAAIHLIDLVLWMTNMLPLQVQGYSNNIATRGSDLKHNDFASLQLLFENGLIAEISAHGGCVHPHFHQLQVFGSEKSFTNTITGQGWLDGCERDTFIREAKGEYPEKMERGKALTSFLDAIVSGNNRPLVDQEAVFNSMSICLAAEQAIQTGREMTIEYI